MHSLLHDDIISIQTNSEVVSVSLPRLLVELAADNVVDFPAVQMHQEHALYTFCAQLGAMAMYRRDLRAFPTGPKTWEKLLLDLSEGSEEAWELLVDDLSKPAFMQSPVWEKTGVDDFASIATTPDRLDRLVCAKNHDLKMARIKKPRIEHWLYALIGRQTMEGYSGGGNYGIARMNSGYGNRSMTALVKDVSWGARFRADVELMLRERSKVVDSIGFSDDGVCVTWLEPWKKKHMFTLDMLDPWFIEISRRIRFVAAKDGLVVYMGTSKAELVQTNDNKGVMGDIWTPIVLEEQPKSWTVDPAGYTYARVAWLLFSGNVKLPATVNLQRGGGTLILQAIPRGQGKTEGFHELFLPLPNRMATEDGLAEVRALTEDRVKVIDSVCKFILYPSLVNYFTGGLTNMSEKRHLVWLSEFKKGVDAMFFPSLWEDLELPPDQRAGAFTRRVLKLSKDIFERAISSGAVSTAGKRKNLAIAENLYDYGVFKAFGSTWNKEQ
jgi:CRISPR system Cascade subunit CasA